MRTIILLLLNFVYTYIYIFPYRSMQNQVIKSTNILNENYKIYSPINLHNMLITMIVI